MRPEPEKPDRLVLNAAHVGGSALAAVTAAVAASSFGVGGTLLGAAFGAAVTAVGSAIYQHSLERARYTYLAVRAAYGPGAIKPVKVAANGSAGSGAEEPAGRRRIPWTPLVALSGIGFVVAMIAITASESAIGHPVSGGRGSGTTIGRIIRDGSSGTPSTPTPSTSVPATTVPTPSDTGTPAPSPTDSAPPSQTPPPTDTGVPTSPADTGTPPADGATQPGVVPSNR
jgi:hypothetical protein